ncbi:MAG TPA: 2-C-methyl-D-erythritol 4-phosphate cytidylyltransferase [Thermoleophilaceae bacterium]|nr:2-C-methyl-D-erythritol 4-phosphate cytidylyltransferase [Thermoleophilaceae bacterium]
MTSVVGVIAAGGSGERLGADRPKAFVVCGGRPLLEWSVDVLSEVCDEVVVAVPAGHEEDIAAPDVRVVAGGASRSDSVRRALAAAPDAAVAVVHDAARPLVTRELVERCLAALGGDVDGVVAAAPVSDTIHAVDAELTVRATPPRSELWAAQTPQVFRADVLRRALDADAQTLAAATDDAALVVAAGGRVRIVCAPRENIKVTTRADLLVAESALC